MNKIRVHDFFWYMRKRYMILQKKEAGKPMPWTKDKVLANRFFCNVFRTDDRTTKHILQMMREQTTADMVLRASIVGRHINRSDQIPLVWDAVVKSDQEELQRVVDNIVFADTYKIHTKRGMWNRQGVAEACSQDLTYDWVNAKSMQEAREILKDTTNSPFLLYQVLLDLWSGGYFLSKFEPNDWIWMAGGTLRALEFLEGNYTYGDQRIGRTAWDRPPHKKEIPELEKRIRTLVTRGHNEQYWPHKWPRLDMHDIEFNLCEFDKYNRVKNEGSQRMHIRYYPVRKRY